MVTHPAIGIIQQGLTYTSLFSSKGNALFKEGKYEAAINCYSTGIQLDPSNAVLSANRAMCLLKLKRYVRDEGQSECLLRLINADTGLDFSLVTKATLSPSKPFLVSSRYAPLCDEQEMSRNVCN